MSTTDKHFADRALAEAGEAHKMTKPSHAKRTVAWAQGAAFVLGALLLVWLIRKVGVQSIFSALARVGFGFFLVVGLNGLRHVLRTIAMCLSVSPAKPPAWAGSANGWSPRPHCHPAASY